MKQSETVFRAWYYLGKLFPWTIFLINDSHWLYTLQIYTVCKSRVEISHRLMEIFLILKRLGEQFDPFLNESAKVIVNSWFSVTFKFLTFNIIISHIIPENFIEIPQVVQKIWILSLTILAIFINFYKFLGFFWHFLVTKRLMTSAYNRWCQYFFTFNIL